MRVGYSVLLSQLVVTVITSLPSSLPRFLYSLRRRRPRGTRVRGEKVTKEPTRRVTEGPRSVTRDAERGEERTDVRSNRRAPGPTVRPLSLTRRRRPQGEERRPKGPTSRGTAGEPDKERDGSQTVHGSEG